MPESDPFYFHFIFIFFILKGAPAPHFIFVRRTGVQTMIPMAWGIVK